MRQQTYQYPAIHHHFVGHVAHYYPRIHVAIVDLADHVGVGDTVRFEGKHSNVVERLESMRVDYRDVPDAWRGDSVGIKVPGKVRKGDIMYRDEIMDE